MYNSLSHKTKQFFWLIIKLSIVIACFYFMYHKLKTNASLELSVFYEILVQNNIFSVQNIFYLLMLSLCNWFLEIKKWKNLASFCVPITFKNATIQSLSSLTTSLITPNRIGEYGAKALYFKPNLRKKILVVNTIGNSYQMAITLLFGGISLLYFLKQHTISLPNTKPYWFFLFVFLTLLVIAFLVRKINLFKNCVQRGITFIKTTPTQLHLQTVLLSALRFLVFSHQFYLLFVIFKIDISYWNAITSIGTVYFLSSIIPILSLFDVVVKATVAVWLFSITTINESFLITLTTIMWILNFVLPAIIGSYFVLTFKTNTTV